MRLRLAVLLATVVTVALGVGMLAAPAGAAPARPAESAIAWGQCDGILYFLGLRCATLEVPLDRASPGGEKVQLALTLSQHTSSPDDYLGVMLTNPGGPGGSGTSRASLADYVPGDVGGRYDWIGFDPRGVGDSVPALHCSRSHFGNNRPSYVPTRQSLYTYWLGKNQKYAAACANTATKQALLGHVTTMDTVLDMEDIRASQDAEKLNFYGFSYGTYLTQVYATQFPDRVGRFVLDGVVDPTRVWYGANADQAVGFSKGIDAFWAYLAKYPRTFRLGSRPAIIKRGYFKLLRRLQHRPAYGKRVGPDELEDTMVQAAYYVYDWDAIGSAYSKLKRKNQGGEIYRLYGASGGDDNGFAMYNATTCTDAPWPGWKQQKADAWKLHKSAPFAAWSNTWYNAPCLYWKAPAATTRPQVSSQGVRTNILLVSETGDAATPYKGALQVRKLFPTSSLIAGVGGTTHASSLSGVACLDNAIAAYLDSGVVPARRPGTGADLQCPAVRPPSPYGRANRTASGHIVDKLPPVLRNDLVAAQLHQ